MIIKLNWNDGSERKKTCRISGILWGGDVFQYANEDERSPRTGITTFPPVDTTDNAAWKINIKQHATTAATTAAATTAAPWKMNYESMMESSALSEDSTRLLAIYCKYIINLSSYQLN